MKKEIVGILGGMGPQASAYLYNNIINYCQKEYNAVQDTDYPHIIINSIGLQGFDETGITNKNLVKKGLLNGILQLDNSGVDKLYMACNTVHKYFDYLQENSKGNIINLIDETVNMVKNKGHKKVLILGSNTTNHSCLYDKYLIKNNIDYIKLNNKEQEKIDTIIENVMGGCISKNDYKYIEKISKYYAEKGATGVIIGCTELPLATKKENIEIEVFDTLDILTKVISKSVKN